MKCPACGAPASATNAFCSVCGQPRPVLGAGDPGTTQTAKVVIGLVIGVIALLVIGFTGMVALIVVPNLIRARERGRQQRTLSQIKRVAEALEKHRVDHNRYPESLAGELPCQALRPYLPECPVGDGWSTPDSPRRLAYLSWDRGNACALASPGSDARFEVERVDEYSPSRTGTFESDIVMINAEFVRVPEGRQRRGSPAAPGFTRLAPPRAARPEPRETAPPPPPPPPSPEQRTRAQLDGLAAPLALHFARHGACPKADGAGPLCKTLLAEGARECAATDAWDHALAYVHWETEGGSGCAVISAGADGRFAAPVPADELRPGAETGDDLRVEEGRSPR